VRDLNMDLEIKGMQTIREPDGLAMSSRNIYLKPEERESALSLSRSLIIAKDLFEKGERNSSTIIGEVKANIDSNPYTKIDYVQICDTTTMKDVDTIEKGKAVIALAVRVGIARLIDNYVFGDSLELKTITF